MAEEKTDEQKKPILKTQDLELGAPMRVKPRPLESVTTRELAAKGGGLALTDNMFIARYADDADLKVLKAILETRISKREPGPFYYVCGKCGWTGKVMRLLEEESPCLHCNKNQRADGGVLKRLKSEKAIAAYEQTIKDLHMKNAAVRKKLAAASAQDWRQRIARGEFS